MKKKRILRAISNKMKIIKGQKSMNTENQVNIWNKKLFSKKESIKIERTLTSLIKAKNKKREREKVQVKWQVSGKKKENFLQIQQI